jgi:hypothetical protein
MVLCLHSHTAIKLDLVDGIEVILTGGGKPKKQQLNVSPHGEKAGLEQII